MTHYSIVLNGLYDPSKLANVRIAREHSDEVIVSTWSETLTSADREALEALSVIVVASPDPGAPHLTYEQSGIEKRLSVRRQVLSARAGVEKASHPVVIRSRVDATLDYDRFHQIWSCSGRRFGAVNLTSVCPSRLLGYPYLFTISDWCHIGRTADLLRGYESTEIDENRLCRTAPLRCGDMTWHSRLAVEQAIALLLSGSDRIYDLEIKAALSDYAADEWAEHARVLSLFANVRQQDVGFLADKYQFLAGRWLAWDDINFRDDGPLKANLGELALLIAGRLREIIRRARAG